MKKFFCLICIAAFCVALSSCAKEPATTDSAASDTDGTVVFSVTFPKATDTDIIYNPTGTDSADTPPDQGVPETPSVNLAMLSDEAAKAALLSSFESSRFQFDINFNGTQTVSSSAGAVASWTGSVWQLGGTKRCEYTLDGKEYKAWVVDGIYYYNQYEDGGASLLKKDSSKDAKNNYLTQQESYYEAIWDLSAQEFNQISMTRNGTSGYTLTCAVPNEDSLKVLSAAADRLTGKQSTGINNASLVASFDKDGILTGYSYSFDFSAQGAAEGLTLRASFSNLNHDAESITVKAPENAGDYKE